MTLNEKRVGITLGALGAIGHFVWALAVAAGVSQGIVNWILQLHFVSMPITIAAFDALTMVELIVVGAIGGFITGYVLAWLWNWSAKIK